MPHIFFKPLSERLVHWSTQGIGWSMPSMGDPSTLASEGSTSAANVSVGFDFDYNVKLLVTGRKSERKEVFTFERF